MPTPTLRWVGCHAVAECATVALPLDYDTPNEATVDVALLRRPATDPARRLGSLFVNPGGPGGSGVQLALQADSFLSPELLARFDIVGVDPRGTNDSTRLQCFATESESRATVNALGRPFPYGKAAEVRAIAANAKLGRACSTTGQPLASAMSTAEAARDLDVLRRAVGDERLSYLGFSYGTYLGQVYANLFPDRVRALALDGVIDPEAWTGAAEGTSVPMGERVDAARSSYAALYGLLVRCDQAGPEVCPFADGDPVANFDLVARRLKRKPIDDFDPATGAPIQFGYPQLISSVLDDLYLPAGAEQIAARMAQLMILTEGTPGTVTDQDDRVTSDEALAALAANLRRSLELQAANPVTASQLTPYANDAEAYAAISCTDAVNPADAGQWPRYANRADGAARYFGRLWTWGQAACGSATWTTRDEDAYYGPFDRVTAAPVLFVGAKWDPATGYVSAVKAHALLPNSWLVSSDNWGHTAYGTSDCVTQRVDRYLLEVAEPNQASWCSGNLHPFR